jgi:ubiquinone/menaquinone biosynthesis C-methylase UbiE
MGFTRGRTQVFERTARGLVLEVGAGTGKNLPYYPQGAFVVATDLSQGMLARAVARAGGQGRRDVRFAVCDVEDLPFKDGVFDAVAASFVFCTVPDPVRGLREVRRVLRHGGQTILLEHVRPRGWLGRLFDLLDPVAHRVLGPHINRRTLDSIREAALAVVEERDVFSHWVKVIVAG